MFHLKKLTCKGTLRQVFIRFYRLEIWSVMLVFLTHFVNCRPSNLLTGSTLPPCVNSSTLCIQCVKGGYGVLGLRQINTCCKVPIQVNFFRWHFSLSSTSLIFLQVHPIAAAPAEVAMGPNSRKSSAFLQDVWTLLSCFVRNYSVNLFLKLISDNYKVCSYI